jgi:glutaredoxin
MGTIVTVYLINDCPYCKKLLGLLNEANIQYETVDIGTEEGEKIFEPVHDISQSYMVPTIVIGERILVPEIGFITIDMAFKIIRMILNEEI